MVAAKCIVQMSSKAQLQDSWTEEEQSKKKKDFILTNTFLPKKHMTKQAAGLIQNVSFS